MKKKSIFIVLIFIILIGIVVAGVSIYFNNKAKYDFEITKVVQINYHVINENNKYGVIDRDGNVVVEAKYDVVQIPNPSKDIFICLYNYNSEEKDYSSDVFNSRGEKLYQEYENVQAIPTETTYDGIPFEKTVLKFKKDGKYGLINLDGKQVLKPEYESITAIPYKEGMLIVKQNEKCGVVNVNGKTLISVEYESITADNYYSEETMYKTTGFIVSKKSDDGYRYGYIDYKGKTIAKTEYTQIDRVTEMQDDKNVYLVAYKNGQAGLLKNKKVVLNYEYEDISYNAYNDVFVIKRNLKEGIADKQGKIKVPTEYTNISFGGIYVNADKDGQFVLLDLMEML